MVQEGVLDENAAAQISDAAAAGKPLDDALRSAKGVSEDKVLRFLAHLFGIQFIDLEKDSEKFAPPKELLAKFPARILLDRRLMPLIANGSSENGDAVAIVTSRIFDHTG